MVLNFCKCFILFAFFLQSCTDNPSERKSVLFRSYIKSEFGMELNEKKSSFFVIPSTGCIGCNQIAIQRFMEEANKENIYLILTRRALRKLDNFNLPENVLIDSNNQIENLNLEALNTSLIMWNQNKIVNTFILTPDNIDSVLVAANLK